MAKKELEKLKEEIKLQELKLKKLELEDELDTDQKDDELDTNQTKTRSLTRAEYLQIKYPKQSKIVAWGFTGLMGLFILYMAFFYESDSQQSSSNNSPSSSSSEISDKYRYEGCDGLIEMVDNGVLYFFDNQQEIDVRNGLWAEERCQFEIDAFRAEDACRGDCPTTEESSIETNSNIEYQGCSGLEELIDDGLFMSDGLAIMQIQSQINMMSDQQCQGLIDKNNSVRESR